jgi:hypothetical protein
MPQFQTARGSGIVRVGDVEFDGEQIADSADRIGNVSWLTSRGNDFVSGSKCSLVILSADLSDVTGPDTFVVKVGP